METDAPNYVCKPITEQPQSAKSTERSQKAIEPPEATRKHAFVKELLMPLDQLIVQAELETAESHYFLDSECTQLRYYYIQNERREQLMSALVESVFGIRVGFGCEPHPPQAKQLRRLHPTRTNDDVMHLFRSLACDGCCCPCSLQLLEVFAPTERLFGSVQQRFNLVNAVYALKNSEGDVMLTVQGYAMRQDMFKILNNEKIEVGTIQRQDVGHIEGSHMTKEAFVLYMKESISEDMKLLLLAATIFIDLMFSEAPKFIRGE